MSQENVEIVEQAFQARARGDNEAIIAMLSEDVEIDASRMVFDPVVLRGHDGFRRFLAIVDEAWAAQTIEAYDITQVGHRLVVPVRLRSTGRTSGAEVRAEAAWIFEIRQRKIVHLGIYQSKAEALKAVGLSG